MAGLATHYKVNKAGTEYTFYLRGHAAPEGVKLAGRESLTPEFSRNLAGSPYNVPARWSDEQLITAEDIVFSWRRYVAPETACSSAYLLFYISGAEDINAGKLPAEDLAVRALDTFAFSVSLGAPGALTLRPCAARRRRYRCLVTQSSRRARVVASPRGHGLGRW